MRMTFPEGTAGWVRRALSFLGIFLGATLLLYVTDIGCIIRTVTGVPCPRLWHDTRLAGVSYRSL